MLIIGFTGYAHSGKDLAYRIIKDSIIEGSMRIAFADELKKEANQIFDFLGHDEIAFTENSVEKEKIRPFLVGLGEYMRFRDKDYWINKIIPKLVYYESWDCPCVVFTDIRYFNEAKFVTDRGGYIVYIHSDVPPANKTEEESIGDIYARYKDNQFLSRFIEINNPRVSVEAYTDTLKEMIAKIRGSKQ